MEDDKEEYGEMKKIQWQCATRSLLRFDRCEFWCVHLQLL